MQKLHYVRKIDDKYAVCGAPVSWATTEMRAVTCEGCLLALCGLTPVAADAEQQQALGDDDPRAAEPVS